MTDRIDAHMDDPAVEQAQAQFDAHLLICNEGCRSAAHQRDGCPTGQQLHDAVVRAAQDAYRAARPEAFAPEPHDG